MKMTLTSAAGVVALLDEQESELKYYALDKINLIVDEFWAEIAEVVNRIEELYEDESFRHRDLSALVASKVYYHLGSFEDSLTYALGAGDLFDVNGHSEYIETIIAKCIDHYTQLCIKRNDNPNETVEIDPRLEAIVNRMFQRCFQDKKYKQAIGIAIETRRLDVFENAILASDDVIGMLTYSLKICMTVIDSRLFRNRVLRVLVKLYMNLKKPDYISVCQCLIFLDDAESVADILKKLVKDTTSHTLMAYQISFDLYENASQQFLSGIINGLKEMAPQPLVEAVDQGTEGQKEKPAESSNEMEVDSAAPPSENQLKEEEEEENKKEPSKEKPSKPLNDDEKVLQSRLENLIGVLAGETTISLHLEFLIRNNHADLLILKNTKDAIRNSICHTATVLSNSLMHCGTTSDTFLRNNLEWLSRATNWAKFTATASLGVIHKGHEKESLKLMASYLPKDSVSASAYQEGGGLYALGLIHANHGSTIVEYLLNELKGASSDMVRHGGCLGLGLAAMGTQRQDIYEELKSNLFLDDAVTGKAAGLAMGLVMLGSKSDEAIESMVMYAQETQHEMILRGLAVGIALIMFGRMEEADSLIETLTRNKDPILRRSGMYTLAMAYAGTGNNKAIRQLLHFAVSDVNDDVRRAAVTSLGFILFRTPEQCPSVVSLLAESYNPHVRCGAALALGIGCAGTGNKEALALVEPMTNDPVNYVRQGALIASALIAIQQTEATCSKVKTLRDSYAKIIGDKHEDSISKFGAIVAQGIIDAGGRNVTVSLQSRAGQIHMPTVVGLFVFTQFWYWFPLGHFLSLAFTPTAVIGLNADLKMPKWQLRSNAKPSAYAYPEPLQPPKKESKEKVSTAILSTTVKSKARAKKQQQQQQKDDAMDVDPAPVKTDSDKSTTDDGEKKTAETPVATKDATTTKANETIADKDDKPKATPTPEPDWQMIENPSRVVPVQLKVLALEKDSRYLPLKSVNVGGILILRDSKAGEPEELIEPLPASTTPSAEEEEDEPEAPEPFEYTED